MFLTSLDCRRISDRSGNTEERRIAGRHRRHLEQNRLCQRPSPYQARAMSGKRDLWARQGPIQPPTTNAYSPDSKDGRTTAFNRGIVAKYECNYRKVLLRLIGCMVRIYGSVQKLSSMREIKRREISPPCSGWRWHKRKQLIIR